MALETLEFKDEDESVGPFRRRLFFVFSLVALCFLILACRLAWLQIINRDLYVERAEQNRTVTTTSQGSRGLIFDRNGTLLAGNRLSWSLEVTSSQTAEPVEQLFDRLAEIIPITSADRRRYRRLRENFNRYDSVPIRTDLTDEEVAVFAAQRWRFQGLELNQREHRIYPEGAVGSHFLGYVGALSLNDKKRLDAAGDLALYQGEREIGKVGLERSYEKTLHGTPGHEILEVSAGGRPVRTLELEAAQPGSNLTLTIDLNLQRVAEKAMTGKTGSVIAIEPKTGRILAFASLPTYDPNLFPGGIDPESWNYLNTAEEKPLLNRAMRGIYPICSTYKPFMALAGLELGAVTADYVLNDTGVFQVGNHKFRDVTGSPRFTFPSQIDCRLIGYLLLLARHSAWSRQNSRLYATVEIWSEDWNRSCRRTDWHSSESRLEGSTFQRALVCRRYTFLGNWAGLQRLYAPTACTCHCNFGQSRHHHDSSSCR